MFQNNVFLCSNQGGIVDPSLNDLDQEDQALIDIVKTLIISPDKSVPYNLREKDQFITMRGQWDQVYT